MRRFVVALALAAFRGTFAQVHLPLRRSLDGSQHRGVNALIDYQHHLNHAERRAAKYAGSPLPALAEQRARLARRAATATIADEVAPAPQKMQKRQAGGADVETPSVGPQKARPSSVKAASTEGYGNIGLDMYAYGDATVSYTVSVNIGTPPRPFTLMIDTGSMDTFVPSDGCATCPNTQNLSTTSSSSLEPDDDLWQVEYGKGWVAGRKATDTLSIANLTLTKHAFGVTLYQGTAFQDGGFDGLLGLGVSADTPGVAPLMKATANSPSHNWTQTWAQTPLEALATRGLVKAQQMGFYLARSEDAVANEGQLTFGGYDQTRVKGELTTYDGSVSQEGFWHVPMDSYAVGAGQATATTGMRAILDTGTTLVMAPVSDAMAIHQAIPGSAPDGMDGFVIPCNTNVDIKLTMGPRSFTIPAKDLTFHEIDSNGVNCTSGISAWSMPNAWLLGDVFLRNVYMRIDGDAKQVALGDAQAPAAGSESKSTAEKGSPRKSAGVRVVAQRTLGLLLVALGLASLV